MCELSAVYYPITYHKMDTFDAGNRPLGAGPWPNDDITTAHASAAQRRSCILADLEGKSRSGLRQQALQRVTPNDSRRLAEKWIAIIDIFHGSIYTCDSYHHPS
jgi:hypothetical protein